MSDKQCACRAIDSYECFAIRYGIHSFEFWDDFDPHSEPTLTELVDCSGGPCECDCHYEDDFEDDFNAAWRP